MPAENFHLIYDFETAIPAGFKSLFFIEEKITVLVPDDGPANEQPRPRIEMYFATGAETGHLRPSAPYFRPDAFMGSLALKVVSNTKPADVGTKEHAAFVSLVRNMLAKASTLFKADRDAADVNGYLPYHSIDSVVSTGSSPHYEGQDGYYETDMSFDLRFSIRPDAWPSE